MASSSKKAESSTVYCYILKKTTQGEKDVTAGLNSNDNGYHKILSLMGIDRTNIEVSRGEFLHLVPSTSTPYSQTAKYQLSRDATMTLTCPKSDVGELTREQYDHLNWSDPLPERRFQAYKVMLTQKEVPKYISPNKHVRPLKKPESFSPSVGTTVLVPSYGRYGQSYYGTVKWIGKFEQREEKMSGIELEKEVAECGDGTTKQGVRHFRCPPNRGIFYAYDSLQPDDRQEECEDSMSPLEQTPDDQELAEKQQEDKELTEKLAAKAKLTEKEEAKSAKEKEEAKSVKEMEKEKLTKEKEVTESGKDFEMKAKRLEEEDQSEEVARLKAQIKRLTTDLEQERRRRQGLETELALERKKNLEMRKEAGSSEVSHSPKLTALRSNKDVNLSWRIERKDVMRIRTLGGGAWGLVYEGWFKGQVVAVKEPHLAIMSEETNKRMEREINIMALIQHPNLVRFIGAVMDEDAQAMKLPPLLVTELLDIDLRSAYKRYNLGTSRLPIFRDVAYALHYLHEHHEPIIHRDVSAPNVLLEALPNEMWRAKLSDFGSANVEKFSKTAAEGAIIYSAPETFPSVDPKKPLAKQTTKVDTFSFGILVCEVITCQMPSPETRHQIIERLKTDWKLMYDLVVECLRERPDQRPSMAEALRVLNSIPNSKKRKMLS